MKKVTGAALVALVGFLIMLAWCHFGHAAPSGPRVNDTVTSTGIDATQLTAIVGSILSAIVALITGFKELASMFWKPRTDEPASTNTP